MSNNSFSLGSNPHKEDCGNQEAKLKNNLHDGIVSLTSNDSLLISAHKASLLLADGSEFCGFSFGAQRSIAGEVVFNTGMVGYPEALTDPSYRGQILVLTFPLIGNYGVPTDEIDDYGLPLNFESYRIQIAGLIVANYSYEHSHWASTMSLGQWLGSNGIPALFGIDTRHLTKKIRDHGSILGKIQFPDQPIEFEDPNCRNLVSEVSFKEVKVFGEGNSPSIIAFDCGIKFNIIRYLANLKKVKLTIVPFDYDLAKNPANIQYDGIFISNGPGDPLMCLSTIESIKFAYGLNPPKPIFGICLGNQLMALAAGAKTFKMKYGNRGMNQPCIDMRTTQCYITPQNHGFAVNSSTLPPQWRTFFINANDLSNEGIIHTSKPFFSVQFHPEAAGGPTDTAFLFDTFISMVNGAPPQLTLLDPHIFDQNVVKKVLLVGSGGLSIGQAGEFDYSGSQAIKALKEEGIEVILINPNIATVQTSKNLGGASPDKVYSLPIKANIVKEILRKERPDGIIVSMGGQTALNVGIELYKSGILDELGVRVLGTPIPIIIATEDRELFSQELAKINETLALSYPATDIASAIEAAEKIGYPVLIRAAFALGGLGSGFAHNREELVELAEKAFAMSDQILIDQDLRGWKEIEYEVVRDCRDNCVTVCNMENFDPLGIHTGDSIVVAPSQTLSNKEYFLLRSTAIKVVKHLGIIGECNIQYALNPHSEKYCIIEVNARLSRSSALASKATGYPLAYVAMKLSLGIDLVSIRNSVTKTTTACFEPSLDYCAVKVPRWDLNKFEHVSNTLGSSMISVGEVMSIGRNFEEAIQKAIRMINPQFGGLEGATVMDKSLDHQLKCPTDRRIFAVQAALEQGYSIDYIHSLTRIDKWFLSKLERIAILRKSLEHHQLKDLTEQMFWTIKSSGFSDTQIAKYIQSSETEVRNKRKFFGVIPIAKQIDTLAAEYPAQTNYLYMTYNQSRQNDLLPEKNPFIVLGCGAYCIGSSVEFDWCAVSCVRELRSLGHKAIVINYNPETVSTDYDESDRLYFEELTLERVLDIYEYECASGVVVSVGGQIPNNLALPLFHQGVHILGTSAQNISRAEDRHQFSAMLDRIGVDQPNWKELTTIEEAAKFSEEVGYPVLIRPSFVLSGAAMNVASNFSQLESYLHEAAIVSKDKPVVISKFIINAKEIEFDAVAKDGIIINYAISEHVENAGVHSGDATLVLPAQKLYVQTIRQVKRIASRIASELEITGPFNIQLLARDNELKVIECNLRASRSFPFVSKTFNVNFITLATQAMVDATIKPFDFSLIDLDYVVVKAPMFSFTRLRGADPRLGVEMASTGEVACFGHNVHEAFLYAMIASGFIVPSQGSTILLAIATEQMKMEFLASATILHELGYQLLGTPGTASFFCEHGIPVSKIEKPVNGSNDTTNVTNDYQVGNDVLALIRQKKIDLVIDVPEGSKKQGELTAGYKIRRTAVDFGVSLITNIKCATLLVEAILKCPAMTITSIEEFYAHSAPPVHILKKPRKISTTL